MDRLKNLQIKKTLALGTIKTLSVYEILSCMTDEQIIEMFNDNLDVQYVLLDYREDLK
jgi:hypothetical protein